MQFVYLSCASQFHAYVWATKNKKNWSNSCCLSVYVGTYVYSNRDDRNNPGRVAELTYIMNIILSYLGVFLMIAKKLFDKKYTTVTRFCVPYSKAVMYNVHTFKLKEKMCDVD